MGHPVVELWLIPFILQHREDPVGAVEVIITLTTGQEPPVFPEKGTVVVLHQVPEVTTHPVEVAVRAVAELLVVLLAVPVVLG